ncbi:zf-HC2 domain-containing protein [Mannheimia indoligenes]|uniref:zf-HC2 domain-containing protein n=1 Tax=Mannheimia indoligenes TaxID=3103145 RepID=UPI002FE60135
MLNCKKITELISLECEKPLTLTQKIELKLHIMMCPRCRSFYKNCHIVEKYVKELKH